MSLEEAFQEVDGVGPATSEKLVEIADDHADEGGDVEAGDVERALMFLDKGRSDAARSVLEAALDE